MQEMGNEMAKVRAPVSSQAWRLLSASALDWYLGMPPTSYVTPSPRLVSLAMGFVHWQWKIILILILFTHAQQAGLIEEMMDDAMESLDDEDLDELADEEVRADEWDLVFCRLCWVHCVTCSANYP